MDLREFWAYSIDQFRTNPWIRGAVDATVVLIVLGCVLLILICVTWLLKRFFRRHEGIDTAHKALLYIITMLGVLILLIGGILGIMLPIIPGVVLILMALLLLRRYHKHRWVEKNIRYLTWKLRMKRSVAKVRVRAKRARKRMVRRIRSGKLGKALRGRGRPAKRR